MTGEPGLNGCEPHTERLFDDGFSEAASKPGLETVDLLNIGGGAESSHGMPDRIDLLDIGVSEPSNFDLLSGSTQNNRSATQSPTHPMDADLIGGTFNPFQQASGTSAAAQPSQPKVFDPFATSASHASAGLDGFDLFQSAPSEPQISQASVSESDPFMNFMDPMQNSGAAAPTNDLMGGWNANNLASSTSSLPGAGATTPPRQTNSKPGGLGAGLGMQGMHRNASGTTLGMPMNGSTGNLGMPRNNSGPNLSESSGGPQQSMDPFADLGNLYLSSEY